MSTLLVRRPRRLRTLLTLCCLLISAPSGSSWAESVAADADRSAVKVAVDPRVELVSIIFRLAGNFEYGRGQVASCTDDVENHFGRFRDHPAVKLAARLRQTRGVSYDACMSMAVHLSFADTLETKVPLDPLPGNLDGRWGIEGAAEFVEQARRFVEETSFREFFEEHRPLYELAESRMQKMLDEHAHLEWFDEFFGRRPKATFTVSLGMLNGGCCYGARCRAADGAEELYCILGVWKTDSEGVPVFDKQMLSTVVHEFCHSYTNPIVERHAAELEAAGKKMFPFVEAAMGRQAYSNWKTMMYESMVRAGVVRYIGRHDGPEAEKIEIFRQKQRQFIWIEELSGLLGEYEAERDKYADLDEFFPRIVAFFDQYADQFAEEQSGLVPEVGRKLDDFAAQLARKIATAAARPKVVSINPKNGSEGVDPSQRKVEVVFDRRMADGSWSMVGGGPNFPEIVGKPSYDETRTVWTVSVKLKPDWSYRFMLNSDRFQAFKSQNGVALAPVTVTFKTGQ